MINILKIASIVTVSFLFSCFGRDDDIVNKMEQIKKIGDDSPILAMNMLDSLTLQVRDESEYLQMKYDLLSLRLHDKADDLPSSDIMAIKVADYFEYKGNDLERQEAYIVI